jgi:diguanylate cyclase (GGDEF)-like protein
MAGPARPEQPHEALLARIHPADVASMTEQLTRLLDGDPDGQVVCTFRAWSEPMQAWRWVEATAGGRGQQDLGALPGRSALCERIEVASRRAEVERTDLAVAVLDLDHFRQVNDTLGHDAGDRLLGAAVERVRSRLRAQDTLGRLGADELVVVLEGLERPSDAAVASTCDELVSAMARPLGVDGHQLRITASVGVAVSDGSARPEELLRQADVATHAAKRAGRGRWIRHTEAMSAAARTRFEVHERMLEALDTGGFNLHYQPIVDLEDGRPVGVEAFVRLRAPDGTALAPDQFLPVAEEHGLMGDIGTEVLKMATRDCVHLSGLVAVNVSPSQLADEQFERIVVRALHASGLEPNRLVLDVTESAVLQQPSDEMAGNLNRLQALGVRFALDDFGSGYSSLDRLRHLPVSFIKIDRTFVDGLTTVGSGDLAVVRAVVGMARSLDIPVVAEGVEQAIQRDVLLDVGVQLAQGHLFARAAPLAELLRSPALTTGVPVTGPR